MRACLTLILILPACWATAQEAAPTAEKPKVPEARIAEAEALLDLHFTDAERALMAADLMENLGRLQTLHAQLPPNDLAPALVFNPFPNGKPPLLPNRPAVFDLAADGVPDDPEDLAFLPVSALAVLLRTGKVSSLQLTELYLRRLETYGPRLECVVTLLGDAARDRARRMDEELRAGTWRGPLHGIPYGAKDLFALKGTRTTWGAAPYQDQVIDDTATVLQRLDDAGAVLTAKLTLGALAMGDVWYGGVTRNPWNLTQGSSGSSAGSASAVAAGLLPFALGTETLGSIVSPATRCGVTGLRPSFGRVSRAGAMALAWSMDKVGPLCRTVEDCAIVFEAIRGEDGRDLSVADAPFPYDGTRGLNGLRIGYAAHAFENDGPGAENRRAALETLRGLGVELVPVTLPKAPMDAMFVILATECGTAFEELTRNNRDDLLVAQHKDAWPNFFRSAQFLPATAYLQANRLRTRLIRDMVAAMAEVDVFITPSFADDVLHITNLTGHPCVVVPAGFDPKGSPVGISFIGRQYGEADLLTAAKAFQNASTHHLQRPLAYLSEALGMPVNPR